jgi:hypothetical protein
MGLFTKETDAQRRSRIAKQAVLFKAAIDLGKQKHLAAMEFFPDYSDRQEFFFLLDCVHPDRIVSLGMMVDAYQNRTPFPKIGGACFLYEK